MQKANRLSQAVMRSSVVWGLLATLGFFTILHSGSLANLPQGKEWQAFFIRYTAGHPIEYVETGMGMIGLAALILKAFDIAGQARLLGKPLLKRNGGDETLEHDPRALLDHLDAVTEAMKETYLYKRVRGAVEFVERNGGADALDEHLKFLADVDAVKVHGSYGFVRILIWAIPIMGFLGTVVGITEAIANISPEALEASLPEVTAGLGVAFDTTALALVEATILMFVQFFVDRREGDLMDKVEVRTNEELDGKFERAVGSSDPQIAAVRRMADAVLKATEQTVSKQSELWQGTIDSAHHRWSELTTAAQQHLQSALEVALERSLSGFASHVTGAARAAADDNQVHWQTVQASLDRSSESLLTTQQELSRQGQVLLQVVQATGEITRLEEVLNHNLSALAGSQNFEETVQSLAAVIHLLTARLGHLPSSAAGISRTDSRGVGQAA